MGYETTDDATFKALADPTRRRMLTALAARPMAVHEVTEMFAISRPAVSKHLRVLSEAGLVTCQPRGKQNLYRTEVEPLEAIADWLGRFWAGRLQTLRDLAERKH